VYPCFAAGRCFSERLVREARRSSDRGLTARHVFNNLTFTISQSSVSCCDLKRDAVARHHANRREEPANKIRVASRQSDAEAKPKRCRGEPKRRRRSHDTLRAETKTLLVLKKKSVVAHALLGVRFAYPIERIANTRRPAGRLSM